MRRLIIGCGYLGLRVARAWQTTGEAYALTRSPQKARQFAELGLSPVVGDVLSADSLQKLPTVDTVLYSVGFDRSSGVTKRSVYVDGLRNVLDIIAPKCRRLIYISSTSVYSQDDGKLVNEDSEPSPADENGQICLDAENEVWNCGLPANGEKTCEAMILRLAGIYGPGRLLRRVEQLQSNEPLTGNPDAWLNLIHVEDAVQTVLAAEGRGVTGSTYLVCDGHPARRAEYFGELAKRLNLEPPRFQDRSSGTSNEKHLNKRCISRKLQQELLVRLTFPSFIEGLANLPELSS